MNLTTAQVLTYLNQGGRKCSKSKLYRVCRKLGITSAGALRCNPQLWSPAAVEELAEAIPTRHPTPIRKAGR